MSNLIRAVDLDRSDFQPGDGPVPNGAGKTTTVGILTGKVIPTAGRAVVNGIDVQPRPAAARQFIGMVQQANTLDRGLDVSRNIAYSSIYWTPDRPRGTEERWRSRRPYGGRA
ncbi:MAG TPA: ATP-binding cassette domain-containing protein [Acidimicrobiales bacterium]|nr:ATP-binding cassette domain-containing protein [Acidimicrobiales bacterium]